MSKKNICLKTVGLALSLMLVFLLSFSVFATGAILIKADRKEAKAGESVSISISLSPDSGVAALDLKIKYDNTKLKLENFDEKASALGGLGSVNEAGTVEGEDRSLINASIVHAEGINSADPILDLNFTVLDDASGLAEVELAVEEDQIYNANHEKLDFKTENGGVEIKTGSNATINGNLANIFTAITAGASILILIVGAIYIYRKKKSIK